MATVIGMMQVVTRSELLIPGPAEALAALIDTRPATAALPPLWHWVYLLDRPAQRELGPEGHPRAGVPAAPGPGHKRMYAGGRAMMRELLLVDRPATRTSRVAATVDKDGRSGRLAFVTVRHEFAQDGRTKVVEETDIVYRAADSSPPDSRLPDSRLPGAAPPAAPVAPGGPSLRVEVDETMLFRFSALTYNAHRIHYDREWARSEGYPDLVVHGPLQVLMMAELLRREGVDLVGRRFSYRLVAPMFGAQTFVVSAERPSDPAAGVAVRDGDGRVTARGTLESPA